MKTETTEAPKNRRPSGPAVPLSEDVHRALKLRAALRNRDMKELADAILRAELAAEIEQIKEAAAA